MIVMSFATLEEQNILISTYILSQPNYTARRNSEIHSIPTESRTLILSNEFATEPRQIELIQPLPVRSDYHHPLQTIIRNRDTEIRSPISLYKSPEQIGNSSIDRNQLNTRQYLQK